METSCLSYGLEEYNICMVDKDFVPAFSYKMLESVI